MRIGDRYQFGDDYFFHIWEITSNTECTIIYSNDGVSVGTKGRCTLDEEWSLPTYKFLGNFSKTSNFTQLYDLFNQE